MPDTTRPTLEDRMAIARSGQAPLRQRVSELEAELTEALQRGDYQRAQALTDDLGPARDDLAHATATVRGLEITITERDRQRGEDEAAIRRERLRAEAQTRLQQATEQERTAIAGARARLNKASAAVEAVRAEIRAALSAEQAARAAHQAVQDARVDLGEIEPGGWPAIGPNHVAVLIEQDPLYRLIMQPR